MPRKIELRLNSQHLEVAFRQVHAEDILSYLRSHASSLNGWNDSYVNRWTQQAYTHYAQDVYRRYSSTELAYMANDFQQKISADNSTNNLCGQTIFTFLANQAKEMLVVIDGHPVCHFEDLLHWRNMTKTLGQDMFTTAFLAMLDIKNMGTRSDFSWPNIIQTDNMRLRRLLGRGISENHFHLYGSAPIFMLSWVTLMNFPEKAYTLRGNTKASVHFSENLNTRFALGQEESTFSWKDIALHACKLRALLFNATQGNNTSSSSLLEDFLKHVDSNRPLAALSEEVTRLRYLHGIPLRQSNEEYLVLDYAITHKCGTELEAHHHRLLFGERNFLYACFTACFTGKFSAVEQQLFFLYLVLKNKIYGELVQNNTRIGYQNFSHYSGRRFDLCSDRYMDEVYRLTLHGTIAGGAIKSFEARIKPESSPVELYRTILEIDHAFCKQASLPIDNIGETPLFYVLHFGKKPFSLGQPCRSKKVRSAELRHTAKQQALATISAMQSSPYLCTRIRGFDACSMEIGCRPEVFATEFRYLRNQAAYITDFGCWDKKKVKAKLQMTYHVGEDFLDITDGLRAIEETINFLEFRRDDRLGHALALGVDVTEYYALKRYQIVLPKQDLLDNLVWMLFTSMSFDISIPQSFSQRIELLCIELYTQIFGNELPANILQLYYEAWRLRGYHPSVFSEYEPNKKAYHRAKYYSAQPYLLYQWQDNASLETLFKKPEVLEICRQYYYEYDIQKRGQDIYTFKVDDAYIKVVCELQQKMQHLIADRGISVECNPTSNVLIGTFKDYHKHPIFKFNSYGLHCIDKQVHGAQISVSINTDDQGLFGTSLENEYALIAASLQSIFDKNQQRVYTDDQIYQYIEHIRILGNAQSFHPNEHILTNE